MVSGGRKMTSDALQAVDLGMCPAVVHDDGDLSFLSLVDFVESANP